MIKAHNRGDKVKYEGDECMVTKVWNHGGTKVYYDLEVVGEVAKFHSKIHLSVHHYSLDKGKN